MAKGASSNRNNQTTRQTGAPATGPAPDSSGPTGQVRLANVSNADDLKAIEALAGTAGLLSKTAANTWALRTLTAPAAGITVAAGNGASGNPTLSLANDLAALEAMASTGMVTRTAAETYAQRTITGDTEIVVANGSGAAGNPTLSIGAAIARVAAVQPLDSDLTAIAALATTTFGRSLLTLADALALRVAAILTTTDAPQFARLGLGAAADATLVVDAVGNVRVGAASGAAGSRIIGRGEHTSAPAGTLATGEWELALYDNGVAPVLRLRYNDAGSTKTIDVGPLV